MPVYSRTTPAPNPEQVNPEEDFPVCEMIRHPAAPAARAVLRLRPNEFMVWWDILRGDHPRFVLTSERLAIREKRKPFQVFELSSIESVSVRGWWTKKLSFKTPSGDRTFKDAMADEPLLTYAAACARDGWVFGELAPGPGHQGSAIGAAAICSACARPIEGGRGELSMGRGLEFLEAALARHVFRCKQCQAPYCDECGHQARWRCGACGGVIGD